MKKVNHWAVFLSNNADKSSFIDLLLKGKAPLLLQEFNGLKGALFSTITLAQFIEEEDKHEGWLISGSYNRGIRTLSSGEQKKALIEYLLSSQPNFIILDNPLDNLDIANQALLIETLTHFSDNTSYIQLINRQRDLLPFIQIGAFWQNNQLTAFNNPEQLTKPIYGFDTSIENKKIPPPIKEYKLQFDELVSFKDVTVNYEARVILKHINWTINKGEFWQLKGPNGSGKTTLLTMINGDNPKAYGQHLTLFGKRKGSGETVWEIKQKIGYLTPSMTDLFSTRHTLEEMIISGFVDSIGLYKQPTDHQIRLAKQWLELIEMEHLKKMVFCKLTLGQQRLALVARAMVKHPPILILDEALAGLDDYNSMLVINLINKIAAESNTAILYVSHKEEV